MPSHQHDSHPHESTDPTTFWEEFYGSGRQPWSGRPNAVLVQELTTRPLLPGSVLDLGCGSGGDAVWFAEKGWTVTGVDISTAALTAAAEAARSAGVETRASWQRLDLNADFPGGSWDLVVASYLHSPVALQREQVLRRAAGVVAAGGTLLVLGHERFPAWHRGPVAALPTTAEVLASLDLDDWVIEHTASVGFAMTSPDGEPGERFDHVVRLRRSSG
jgi:SAM-dependent methyltransferase